ISVSAAEIKIPAPGAGNEAPLLTLKVYGYVKLDAAYDTQKTSAGDVLFYVLPKVNGESDNEFNMTARETRLGLELAGPDIENLKTTAKIEADFYGNGGSQNSPNLRLRLAYLDVAMPSGTAVRAGQDWETFMTVIPRTVNIAIMADVGALGLRRPQFRVTQDIPIYAKTKLVAKVAAARTIGEDIDGGMQDDGADSGYPSVQYNLCLETPLLTAKATKLSVSGHWGNETMDSTVSNVVVDTDVKDYNTWSVIGSLFLPLHQNVALQGTIWQGKNLDTYYGGIGQGINKTLQKGIGARGGYIQLITDLTDRLNWNLAYGIDDPDNQDLNNGNRSKNQTLVTSAYYKITSAVTAAFEYYYMTTSYKGQSAASDNRFQGAMIYKF
ncbi:MAG: DcaP family trimeric outer membrane transporter, partial [Kiritimatiellota bacterium]|nr:DcaP family trimeric outer membrane transporter [Kiritimatiellota bacterium]